MQESRRNFLKLAGLAGAGLAAVGLAGCQVPGAGIKTATTQDDAAHGTAPAAGGGTDWQTMDRMHEEGVKAFLAGQKTEGQGNQLLQPTMDGNVKVFNITCKKIKWETVAGTRLDAYSYNGTVPGPLLRVTEGDRVRIVVKNEMDESTAVHMHGVLLENAMDGVPFITQPPIPPGGTFTYEFTAANPGSHMYHSHHNAAIQTTGGLLGAFIVDPKDPAVKNKYRETQDHVMILNDGMLGYTLNGKGFPATSPIVAKKGERIRVRFMNEGNIIHPMHLHGLTMEVVEKDGYPLIAPYKCDTLNIAPGERYDVIVDCHNPGAWAFHCHILPHAESQHGMHGMVTALVVQ